MKKLSKLEKILLVINIIFISTLFVLNYFYQYNNFNYTLKCICSSIFAVLGLINLGYALFIKSENKKFFITMAIGLVLAMLGDVVINKSFIPGAGLFALGHVFFVIAYCFLHKINWLEIVISGVIFVAAGCFLLFSPILDFGEDLLKIVCVIYALIISCMVGKATGNFIRYKGTINLLIMISSFLFFFSDLMLVLDWFILEQYEMSWTNEACMATYYPALCIFAFSLYLKASNLIETKR